MSSIIKSLVEDHMINCQTIEIRIIAQEIRQLSESVDAAAAGIEAYTKVTLKEAASVRSKIEQGRMDVESSLGLIQSMKGSFIQLFSYAERLSEYLVDLSADTRQIDNDMSKLVQQMKAMGIFVQQNLNQVFRIERLKTAKSTLIDKTEGYQNIS